MGDPREGVPESVSLWGDRRTFNDFASQTELLSPQALPSVKTWDQLTRLGKVGRVVSVPQAVITAALNPRTSPRLSEILSLEKSVCRKL